MDAVAWQDLIEQVVVFTRCCCGDHLVALYVCGSHARGQGLDGGSDLDLILVRPCTPEAERRGQEWVEQLHDRLGYRLAPVVLADHDVLRGGDWRTAGWVWRLKDARLLLGQDLRPRLRLPRPQVLRQWVVGLALASVRELYGIADQEPLPDCLEAPEELSATADPAGNVAWQVATAVLQLLRAIALVDGGYLYHGRQELAAGLRACAEPDLAALCHQAFAVRAGISQREPAGDLPQAVRPMAEAIPQLYARLRELTVLPDPLGTRLSAGQCR